MNFYDGVKLQKMSPMILVLLTLLIYLIRCMYRRFRGRTGAQPLQHQQQQHQQQPQPEKQSGWPYGARSTRDRREGLILQILGWYAFPARRAGRTRVPAPGVGSRLRCLRRVADAVYLRKKKRRMRKRGRDPLRGGAGGAAASRRRRSETGALATLASTVANLAAKLDKLQANFQQTATTSKKTTNTTTTPKRTTPKKTTNTTTTTLWNNLQDLFHKAARGAPPSDQQLLSALSHFVATNGGRANKDEEQQRGRWCDMEDGPGDSPITPRPRPPKRAELERPRSYADAARRQGPARLHAGQWEARVLTAQQLRSDPLTTAAVVACNSADEVEKSRLWHEARGAPVDLTLVNLADKDAATKVMVMETTGPRLRPASLTRLGENAPQPRALPKGVADDAPMEQQQRAELALCRLTMARDFAPVDLINKAMGEAGQASG